MSTSMAPENPLPRPAPGASIREHTASADDEDEGPAQHHAFRPEDAPKAVAPQRNPLKHYAVSGKSSGVQPNNGFRLLQRQRLRSNGSCLAGRGGETGASSLWASC